MFLKEIALFLSVYFSLCESEITTLNEIPHRSRRQLLFPNSTLLQFNAGIGTPSPAEKINVNWALQANFQLPWNRSQIPIDLLEANSGYTGYSRRRRELEGYENDAKLYHFYEFVEEVLNGFGENGTACVLQSLCRLAAEPLHPADHEDLLHDIVSFVLNPTNDMSLGLKPTDEQYRYVEAYKQGENGGDCLQLYSKCTRSLIDMFTVLES